MEKEKPIIPEPGSTQYFEVPTLNIDIKISNPVEEDKPCEKQP
jgi:hypothetical protein